jgi:hypothetical protein
MGLTEADDLRISNLLTGGSIHLVGSRQHIRLDPDAPATIFTAEKLR